MHVQPSLPLARSSRQMIRRCAAVTCMAFGATLLLPPLWAAAAEAPIDLGTATSFAVLSGAGITNTGPTTITGDVGTHPTDSETGFDDVTLIGANHPGGPVAQQAKTDLNTAYVTAAGRGPATDVETELGGLTLTPGVYGNETLGITGTLTLNTLGDPNAVFIFQAGSTLITASSSHVIVLGGGTACNVFWQIGSSATLGTDSDLIGTVMASAAITAGTRATVQGRLLAQTESVTLDTNTITRPTCAPPSGGTDGTDGTDGGTDVGDGGGTGGTTDGTGGTTDGTGGTTDDGTTDGTGGTTDDGTTDGGTTGGATTGGGTDDEQDSEGGGGPPSGSLGGPRGPEDDGSSDSSTFTGLSRPGLPVTGAGTALALLGAALTTLGIVFLRGSRHRRDQL